MANIAGLNKAKLLAALYNAAKSATGFGLLHAQSTPMTEAEARQHLGLGDDNTKMFPKVLKAKGYFDYLQGRPLKVDLSGDELDTRLYNRDNGQGKAEEIVNRLRQEQEASSAAEG